MAKNKFKHFDKIGKFIEEVYGAPFEREAHMFCCPECGDWITFDDYPDVDDACPICGFSWYDDVD